MAKAPSGKISKNARVNKKESHPCYGPCHDCGVTTHTGKPLDDGEMVKFHPIRRVGVTGRARMITLCDNCLVKA